jgi:hypothetical protein
MPTAWVHVVANGNSFLAPIAVTFQPSPSTISVSLAAIPVDRCSSLLCLQVCTQFLYDSLLFPTLIKHFNRALQPFLYRLPRSQLIGAHHYFACRCPRLLNLVAKLKYDWQPVEKLQLARLRVDLHQSSKFEIAWEKQQGLFAEV